MAAHSFASDIQRAARSPVRRDVDAVSAGKKKPDQMAGLNVRVRRGRRTLEEENRSANFWDLLCGCYTNKICEKAHAIGSLRVNSVTFRDSFSFLVLLAALLAPCRDQKKPGLIDRVKMWVQGKRTLEKEEIRSASL